MNKVIYTLTCARAGEKEIYERLIIFIPNFIRRAYTGEKEIYERLISFFPIFIRRAYTGVQQYFE